MEELDGSRIQWNGSRKQPFLIHAEQYSLGRTPLASDQETWNALRGRCHSAAQARKLFALHGHETVSRQHLSDLASFIDQAENFYLSGENLSVRSRPLLLYYAYLNLSKALLLLKSNSLPPEGHGFQNDNNIANLDKPLKSQLVKFKNRGVAVDLFDIFDIDMRDKEVTLNEPFAFVPDISGQVNETNYTYSPRMYKFGYTAGKIWRISQDDGNYFNLIALRTNPSGMKLLPELGKLPRFYNNFHNSYRPINVDLDLYETQFLKNIREQGGTYTFFAGKSKQWNTWQDMDQDLYESLDHTVMESVVPDDEDFYIYFPVDDHSPKKLNEFLAIYLATFFFSGVVRYRPSYLQTISNKEDSWLYESFMEATPRKMLRYYHMLITKKLEILHRY